MTKTCIAFGYRTQLMDPELDPDPLVRSSDPDPHQNVTDPQHCGFCHPDPQKLIFH
jgi:hypothetical protein